MPVPEINILEFLEIIRKIEKFFKSVLKRNFNADKTFLTQFDAKHILFLGYTEKIARNKKYLIKNLMKSLFTDGIQDTESNKPFLYNV